MGGKRVKPISWKKSDGKQHVFKPVEPVISQAELLKLGGGHVAYIRTMSPAQAKAMFPNVEGLPQNVALYCLHAADGTPVALTDSMQAAVGHAMGDDLEIQTLH